MPPIRTASVPIKPTKTERSHEENQERAYIAASRRSDRSLEARVESARRASEIHKKRTGRSLRVREEDVLNEEMYEEEDDDLPMQFRRLSALNPGGFHERLSSYMTTQIGMRAALHHAIYQANQYNNANSYLNSILATNGYQPGMLSASHPALAPMGSPSQMQSPETTAKLDDLQLQQQQHQQMHRVSTPQHHSNSPANLHSRSMSFPMHSASQMPAVSSPSSYSQTAISSLPPTPHLDPVTKASPSPRQIPSPPHSTHGQPVDSLATAVLSPRVKFEASTAISDSTTNPLTTQLPNETRLLLNGYQGYNQTGWPLSEHDDLDKKFANAPDHKLADAEQNFSYGNLDQTLSRHAYDLSAPPFQASTPFASNPASMSGYNFDLGFNNESGPSAFGSLEFDQLGTSQEHHGGYSNLDPVWNPDEFVDYQD